MSFTKWRNDYPSSLVMKIMIKKICAPNTPRSTLTSCEPLTSARLAEPRI